MTETAALALQSVRAVTSPTRAEIDLDALRTNLRMLRRLAGDADVMGIVKANAYGHGVEHVVPVLRAEGVRIFAVANVPEAVRLRELGVTERILVFAAPLPDALPVYAAHDLEVDRLVARRGRGRRRARAAAPRPRQGRHGDGPDRASAGRGRRGDGGACGRRRMSRLSGCGRTSRRPTSGTHRSPRRRRRSFERVAAEVGEPLPPLHLANSGALVQLPEAVRHRAFVRVGGLLYGIPSSDLLAERTDTKPVMRLVTRVVHLKTVQPGETVSYGRTWTAEAPTRIATLPIGYGDGLPRRLSNRGEVGVGGRRYPIAGRVCMDMTMLDLGAPDGPGASVNIGDEAVVFGPGGPSAFEAAEAAGTISYALPCGLTARVPRVVSE